MAQGRVIVQILVAQRNPEYPLAQKIRHAMAQLAPLTRIAKPTRHRRRQAEPPDATATHRHCSSPHRRQNPPRRGARDRLEKKADQSYNPSPPRSRVRFCLTN